MTVAVIGGGASGMMAALSAARCGNEVYLLERQARVGRKLLATGNGRCNLTNLHIAEENYHGAPAKFLRPSFALLGMQDTLDFFSELGLLTTAEENGRVYPLSDQAGSVVDVLRFALEEAGVEVKTAFEVMKVRKKGSGFLVASAEEQVRADKLIVCCGGMAGGKLGGTKSGYEILAGFGHTMTKLYPALVQIKTDATFVRALKGVRADAAICVKRGGELLDERCGELQFTEFGVSGPVTFEISRTVSSAKGTLHLEIDLLRKLEREEIVRLLLQRQGVLPGLTTENLLTGMLHNRLGRTILRYAGYDLTTPIAVLRRKDFEKIAAAIKCFELPVIGALGFDGAQVTAGGVRTEEFDPETLQSRLVPGLYAAGEVLDVDGDCGGYNLQWAWSSGYLAGQTRK